METQIELKTQNDRLKDAWHKRKVRNWTPKQAKYLKNGKPVFILIDGCFYEFRFFDSKEQKINKMIAVLERKIRSMKKGLKNGN
jgi:hypothetical protein